MQEKARNHTVKVSVTKKNEMLSSERRSWVRITTPRKSIPMVVTRVGTAYGLTA
jgi:hypothetical protein